MTHDFRKKSGSGGHCGGICRDEEPSAHCLVELRRATNRLDREVFWSKQSWGIFAMGTVNQTSASEHGEWRYGWHVLLPFLTRTAEVDHVDHVRTSARRSHPGRTPELRWHIAQPVLSSRSSSICSGPSSWKGCVCHFSWHGPLRASYRAHGCPHLPRRQA